MGDTRLVPFGRGAFASRGAIFGANAVRGAAAILRDKVLAHAATLLQCDPGMLAIRHGRILRRDGEPTSLGLADIAGAASPGGAPLLREGALGSTRL